MKAAIAVSGLILITTLKAAYADDIDPAPSGNEQAVIYAAPDVQITTPGANSPVESTTSGSKQTLDFPSTQVENPNPDNTTIIYPTGN